MFTALGSEAVETVNRPTQRRRKALRAAGRVVLENLELRQLLSVALDNSFGGDGMIETPYFQDVAPLADNKIMGSRQDFYVSAKVLKLYRYNANGSIDTTYGSGGVINISIPFYATTSRIVGNQVYVAGSGNPTTQGAYLLARYSLDGVLDTSFGGGDGVASASFQPFYDQPLYGQPMNILPAADGDIVVGGWLEPTNDSDQQAGVARFNSDGSLDTTFDGDGTVEEYIPPHSLGPSEYTMAPNGDVFTTARYFDYQPVAQYHDVYGFHRDGSGFRGPDPQPSAFQSGGRALLVYNDNRILRTNADYSADTTFNQNGLNLGANDHIAQLLVLPNDQILVSGSAAGQTVSFVGRLLPNGAADTSLAPGGIFRFAQGTSTNVAGDIDVAPDGRLVVKNFFTSTPDTTQRYGLVRLSESTGSAQSPFLGSPFNVNTTIQAEDFDKGGQGVAYNDFDATNNGGKYRPTEAVDIESTTDTGGGYDVGWTMPGEWVEYTINVPTAGAYTIQTRVASPKTGGSIHYEIDGQNVSRSISVPNTGGFQNFTTITSNLGTLSAGNHVLRLAINPSPNGGGVANINWMKIVGSGGGGGGGGGSGTGLTGQYFNNMDFTAPVFSRTDAKIDFNWGSGSPDSRIQPDTFSVRWTGQISAPTSGRYTFYTTTDDGVRLTVNGAVLWENGYPQGTYTITVSQKSGAKSGS